MAYVPLEKQFAYLYDVLRRAMAADPAYKVGGVVLCLFESGRRRRSSRFVVSFVRLLGSRRGAL